MLELSELDNEITKKQLNRTFPNKVDIKFGLDANKIKGVNNFPIYYETDGFTSHAKQNVDSFMFHTPHNTNKYNVAKPTHTPVGEIRPYLFDKQSPSQPKETNVRIKQGEMSSLYGLPPDKTIVLENPTAQAMGKMTEEEFTVKQWRADPDGTSGLPAELEEIISGEPQPAPPLSQHTSSTTSTKPAGIRSKKSSGTPTATAISTATETTSPVPSLSPTKRNRPVVLQAFETPIKTEESTNPPIKGSSIVKTEESTTPIKTNKTQLLKEIDDFAVGKDKLLVAEDRDKMDKLLKDNGFKIPNKGIKILLSYIKEFKAIVSNIKSPKTKRTPQKKQSPLEKFAFSTDEQQLFFEDETKKIH